MLRVLDWKESTMLWIDKFTEFCKNIGGPLDDGAASLSEHESRQSAFVNESNQIWAFEPEPVIPPRTLTPKEHGDRLLQRTKETALRRLWAKEHGSSYTH